MPERPAVFQGLMLESLEGRLVLSSMTLYPLSRAEMAGNTAEVAWLAFNQRVSKTAAVGVFESSTGGQGRNVRLEVNMEAGATREARVDVTRAIGLSMEITPRSRKLSGHSYGPSLGSFAAQSSLGDTNGAMVLPSTDEVSGSAALVESGSGDSSGMSGGFDGRNSSWKPLAVSIGGISAVGLVAITGQEMTAWPLSDTSASADHQINDIARLDVATIISGARQTTTMLADLLEGVLQSDWDDIDLEMRRFLSRLGTMVDGSAGQTVVPTWPVWIGAAAIVVYLRRFSQGIGPRQQQVPRVLRLARRRPAPLGPWPLDSP